MNDKWFDRFIAIVSLVVSVFSVGLAIGLVLAR